MRCSTVEVSRGGAKVIINESDFDGTTMVSWSDFMKKAARNDMPDYRAAVSEVLVSAPPLPVNHK